jgi:hypothetical protein
VALIEAERFWSALLTCLAVRLARTSLCAAALVGCCLGGSCVRLCIGCGPSWSKRLTGCRYGSLVAACWLWRGPSGQSCGVRSGIGTGVAWGKCCEEDCCPVGPGAGMAGMRRAAGADVQLLVVASPAGEQSGFMGVDETDASSWCPVVALCMPLRNSSWSHRKHYFRNHCAQSEDCTNVW